MNTEIMLNKLAKRYNEINLKKQNLISLRNELVKSNSNLETMIDDEIIDILEQEDNTNSKNDKIIKFNFFVTLIVLATLYKKYGIDNIQLLISTPFVFIGATSLPAIVSNIINNDIHVVSNKYDKEIQINDNRLVDIENQINECNKILEDIERIIKEFNSNVELTASNNINNSKIKKLTK